MLRRRRERLLLGVPGAAAAAAAAASAAISAALGTSTTSDGFSGSGAGLMLPIRASPCLPRGEMGCTPLEGYSGRPLQAAERKHKGPLLRH